MTALTLTFLGSHVSYQPTEIKTKVDNKNVLKYRGAGYKHSQTVEQQAGFKGLKFRGVAY